MRCGTCPPVREIHRYEMQKESLHSGVTIIQLEYANVTTSLLRGTRKIHPHRRGMMCRLQNVRRQELALFPLLDSISQTEAHFFPLFSLAARKMAQEVRGTQDSIQLPCDQVFPLVGIYSGEMKLYVHIIPAHKC